MQCDRAMKCIELTRGKVAIVDDGDFEYLAQWRWFCSVKGYAVRSTYPDGPRNWKNIKTVWMHREILKPRDEFETDHINGNKLDNRRCNLREVDDVQQNWNKGARKTNKLGVKGVHLRHGKYLVRIGIGTQNKQVGLFNTLEEAKAAYNRAAIELRGTFARLN
jgi:hypothetical protein